MITYHCSSPNYFLNGRNVRTCYSNGRWTGSTPSCVQGTYNPHAIQNLMYVSVNYSNFVLNTVPDYVITIPHDLYLQVAHVQQ